MHTYGRCDDCQRKFDLRSMVVLGRGLCGSLLCKRCANRFRLGQRALAG